MHLEAYNYPSRLTHEKVDTLAKLFGIDTPYKAVAPELNDRACYPKQGAIRIYKETLYTGFRFPHPPFVFRLLTEARDCPTQLVSNAWRFIYYF